jgi:hypothetical protein
MRPESEIRNRLRAGESWIRTFAPPVTVSSVGAGRPLPACEGVGAVQRDFFCSACHSVEPIADVVWVGCGLSRCSAASALRPYNSNIPSLFIGSTSNSLNAVHCNSPSKAINRSSSAVMIGFLILILLSSSLVIVAPVPSSQHQWREAILFLSRLHAPPRSAALPPRRAVALCARRAVLEACGCALFAVSILAASLAFTWPAGLQEAVVGFTILVTATRLTAIVVRVLLSPDCPRLRLLPLDDTTAWQVRRIAVGLAAFVVVGSSLRSLCDRSLAAPGLGFIVSLVAGLGIFGFALGGIRLWSVRLNTVERRRVVPAASTVLPFLGAAAAVAGVAFTLLGASQLASSIGIGFAAVVAARTTRVLIDIFTAEPAPGTQAGDAGRPGVYRPVLRRMALLIVIGCALAALAGGWGISMQDLWQSKGVGRLLGGGLEATVVVLLADLAWLWAKTAIDRRVPAADGPVRALASPAAARG